MKVLKDEDLLSLHYQIEKAEIKQKKLEELYGRVSNRLKKSKKLNKLLQFISLFLLFITTLSVVYFFVFKKKSDATNIKSEVSLVDEGLANTSGISETIISEGARSTDIEKIKNLYLYRSLINKDTIYSVQLKAFSSDRKPAISEKFINGLVYSDTSLYKISLGIFETLLEAQEYRRMLIGSGFDKKIFIISYKEGKRLRIENFQ